MLLRPNHIYTARVTVLGAQWRAESLINARGAQEFDLYRNGHLYASGLAWDALRASIRDGYPAEAGTVVAALGRAKVIESRA